MAGPVFGIVADQVVVDLQARVNDYLRDVNRAERGFRTSMRNTEAQAVRTERTIQGSFGRMGRSALTLATRFGGPLVALAAMAKGINDVVRNGDRLRQLEGRFTALTGSVARGEQKMRDLFDIVRQTGGEVEGTASALTRFTIAAENINATDAEVKQLVVNIQRLGAIGGAATGELASGAVQLGQALASGRLQGDELRSILENLPLVARAIADGLGVTVGQLREMGAEGRIMARDVFDAILAKTDDVNKAFDELPPSLERSANRLAGAWSVFTAELDESLGISRALAGVLEAIAGQLEAIASAGERAFSNAFDAVVDQQRILKEVEASGADDLYVESVRKQVEATRRAFFAKFFRDVRVDKRDEFDPRGAFQQPAVKTRDYVAPEFAPMFPIRPEEFGGPIDLTKEPEKSTRSGRRGGGRSREDTVAREIDAIRARVEALALEEAKIGRVESAQVELEAAFDRDVMIREAMERAQRRGVDLTEEEKDRIIELADSYMQKVIQIDAAERAYRAEQEMIERVLRETEELEAAQKRAWQTTANVIANAIEQGNSFLDVIKRIGFELLKLTISGLDGEGPFGDILGGVLGSAFPSIFGSGGAPETSPLPVPRPAFAGGGLIGGKGSGKSDSNLVRASRGEYILNADAVSRIGVDALDAMNDGVVGYATGGLVGDMRASSASAMPTPVVLRETVGITVDVTGANGDEAVARIARNSVIAGITEYDRRLPGRLKSAIPEANKRYL